MISSAPACTNDSRVTSTMPVPADPLSNGRPELLYPRLELRSWLSLRGSCVSSPGIIPAYRLVIQLQFCLLCHTERSPRGSIVQASFCLGHLPCTWWNAQLRHRWEMNGLNPQNVRLRSVLPSCGHILHCPLKPIDRIRTFSSSHSQRGFKTGRPMVPCIAQRQMTDPEWRWQDQV